MRELKGFKLFFVVDVPEPMQKNNVLLVHTHRILIVQGFKVLVLACSIFVYTSNSPMRLQLPLH